MKCKVCGLNTLYCSYDENGNEFKGSGCMDTRTRSVNDSDGSDLYMHLIVYHESACLWKNVWHLMHRTLG